MIQDRYRKGPLSQRSAHAEQYAQTKTNTKTNPNPDPSRYRRRYILTLMLGYTTEVYTLHGNSGHFR